MCWQVSTSGEEERIFLLLVPLCRSPAEGVAQNKGVYHHGCGCLLIALPWKGGKSVMAESSGFYPETLPHLVRWKNDQGWSQYQPWGATCMCVCLLSTMGCHMYVCLLFEPWVLILETVFWKHLWFLIIISFHRYILIHACKCVRARMQKCRLCRSSPGLESAFPQDSQSGEWHVRVWEVLGLLMCANTVP